jgi:CII-binding regulator of phage lambda lysogenization HflD
VRDIQVGQRLALSGRIQSREYVKKLSEEQTVSKVAYEVSINKIGIDGLEQSQWAGNVSDVAFAEDARVGE